MKIKNKIEPIQKILKNMQEDHISESSAQCAYYVILSFIPFVILLLTLTQYINIEPQQLINIVSKIIPDNMSEMVVGIIMEVYSKSIGTISISLIFTLFAADRGLFALMKALHLIYNFNDNTNKSWIHLKLISLIQTVIFIVLVALGVVLMLFGNSIIATAQDKFGAFENYTVISQIITYLCYLLITFIIFICIYRFLPGHKMKMKEHVIGALFAAVALNIISFIFSKYLEIFKGFSTTYGSLTTLMLIMMWIYSCFYIILLGAEINKYCSIQLKRRKN